MYRIIQLSGNYSDYPKTYATLIIGALLAVAIFNFVIVPFHNCVKYFFIKLFGDETAIHDGYLTMRPKTNIHVVGLVTSVMLNIGFSAPAYFDTEEFRKPGLGSFVIGLSGVFTYGVCFLISFFTYVMLTLNNSFGMTTVNFKSESIGFGGYLYFSFIVIMYYIAITCLYSAIINLIPVFPLDMGDALYEHLPLNWQDALRNNELFVCLGIFIVCFLYLGSANGIIPTISKGIMNNCRDVIELLL